MSTNDIATWEAQRRGQPKPVRYAAETAGDVGEQQRQWASASADRLDQSNQQAQQRYQQDRAAQDAAAQQQQAGYQAGSTHVHRYINAKLGPPKSIWSAAYRDFVENLGNNLSRM